MITRTYPNELRGVVDDQTFRVLMDLYNKIYELSDALATQQPPTLDLAAIRNQLQAGGTQPLNVGGLLGVLSQAQIGGAPAFENFPPPIDPRSQDGALGVLSSTLSIIYRYSATLRQWVATAAAGIVSILLNAVAIGSRATLNLIEGAGINLTVTDNSGANRVDITFAVNVTTGWSDWTGTLVRTTQNADDTTTASVGYVQAEAQAVNDRLAATRSRLGKLINDLRAAGFLST